MDEVAQYNIERWNALVEANAVFTRPAVHLDPSLAQAELDPERRLGTVVGKDVLCLACGGGQQAVAFALLGAKVTVVDLSAAQLDRDRAAAAHFGVAITMLQGDMRNLACLEAATFDIVYLAYSLGFVPNASVVFQQVATRLSDDCNTLTISLQQLHHFAAHITPDARNQQRGVHDLFLSAT